MSEGREEGRWLSEAREVVREVVERGGEWREVVE